MQLVVRGTLREKRHMSLYKTQLRQAIGGGLSPDAYKYSNTLHIEAANVEAAAVKMAELWTAHMVAWNSVFCYAYEVYATDLVLHTTNFTTLPITPSLQRGHFNQGDIQSNLYASGIAYRLDLTVPSGFASRKWLRFGMIESDVAPGGHNLSNATIENALLAGWAAIVADDSVRDESGHHFSGVASHGLQNKRLGKFARYQIPPPPPFG
jgi:hypothetical protein